MNTRHPRSTPNAHTLSLLVALPISVASPECAPQPKNSHAYINYNLEAEHDKRITKTILYPTPNTAANALMPDDYMNNPVIFPPADVLARCEYAKFNPELQPLYEEAFTRVRAS